MNDKLDLLDLCHEDKFITIHDVKSHKFTCDLQIIKGTSEHIDKDLNINYAIFVDVNLFPTNLKSRPV